MAPDRIAQSSPSEKEPMELTMDYCQSATSGTTIAESCSIRSGWTIPQNVGWKDRPEEIRHRVKRTD